MYGMSLYPKHSRSHTQTHTHKFTKQDKQSYLRIVLSCSNVPSKLQTRVCSLSRVSKQAASFRIHIYIYIYIVRKVRHTHSHWDWNHLAVDWSKHTGSPVYAQSSTNVSGDCTCEVVDDEHCAINERESKLLASKSK
jgi:hypothetical protein